MLLDVSQEGDLKEMPNDLEIQTSAFCDGYHT